MTGPARRPLLRRPRRWPRRPDPVRGRRRSPARRSRRPSAAAPGHGHARRVDVHDPDPGGAASSPGSGTWTTTGCSTSRSTVGAGRPVVDHADARRLPRHPASRRARTGSPTRSSCPSTRPTTRRCRHIDTPDGSLHWSVGDDDPFSGSATDDRGRQAAGLGARLDGRHPPLRRRHLPRPHRPDVRRASRPGRSRRRTTTTPRTWCCG